MMEVYAGTRNPYRLCAGLRRLELDSSGGADLYGESKDTIARPPGTGITRVQAGPGPMIPWKRDFAEEKRPTAADTDPQFVHLVKARKKREAEKRREVAWAQMDKEAAARREERERARHEARVFYVSLQNRQGHEEQSGHWTLEDTVTKRAVWFSAMRERNHGTAFTGPNGLAEFEKRFGWGVRELAAAEMFHAISPRSYAEWLADIADSEQNLNEDQIAMYLGWPVEEIRELVELKAIPHRCTRGKVLFTLSDFVVGGWFR